MSNRLNIEPVLKDIQLGISSEGSPLTLEPGENQHGEPILGIYQEGDTATGRQLQWEVAAPHTPLTPLEQDDGDNDRWRIGDVPSPAYAARRVEEVSLRDLVDVLPDETAVWAVAVHQERLKRHEGMLRDAAPGKYPAIERHVAALSADLRGHMHRG